MKEEFTFNEGDKIFCDFTKDSYHCSKEIDPFKQDRITFDKCVKIDLKETGIEIRPCFNAETTLKNSIKIFDPLFEKIHGAYFAIIAACAGVFTIIIAALVFFTIEPFDFFSHWISNLGGTITNTGKFTNGLSILFSTGLIVTAIFIMPFILYLAKTLLTDGQKHHILIMIALIFGIGLIVGIFGVAIFNLKSYIIIHIIFATIFFVSIGGMVIFFTLAMFFNSDASLSQALIGVITIIITIAFYTSYMIWSLQGIDPITIVSSTDNKFIFIRFYEWIIIITFFFWLLVNGIYILISDNSETNFNSFEINVDLD